MEIIINAALIDSESVPASEFSSGFKTIALHIATTPNKAPTIHQHRIASTVGYGMDISVGSVQLISMI